MTTDKRAAAIAAIKRDTATEIDQLCYARQGEWARLGGLAIDRLTLRDLAILIADRAIEKVAALEADDGRVLLERLRRKIHGEFVKALAERDAAVAAQNAAQRCVFEGLTANHQPPHLVPSEKLREALVELRAALRAAKENQ